MSCVTLLVRAIFIRVLALLYSLKAALILLRQWWSTKGTERQNFFAPAPHIQRPKVLEDWTHGFLLVNDIKLHFVERGSPEAPLMLCLHGFPEFWYSWRYQLRHFDTKYRVVAVDLRGYGDSDKPHGVENYRLDLVVRDIELFIEQLGYSKAVVLAHDFGGAVAWRLAMKRPDLFERFVAMNIPHPKVFGELLKRSAQRAKSWYFFMFLSPWLPEMFMSANDYANLAAVFRSPETGLRQLQHFTDDDLEAWKYVYSVEGALTPPMNYNRAIMSQWRPTEFENPMIEPKTLLIWGEQDGFLVNEGADLTLPLLRDGRVARITNAAHWVQQDAPEEVNRLIEQFLAEN